MAKPQTIKPEELSARSYVDRLILTQLTELESVVKLSEISDRLANEGIGLSTVRALLASNPERFAYHERRWIPAARIASHSRPFAQSLAIYLDRFGGPMSVTELAKEMSLNRHESTEKLEATIRRFGTVNREFVLTHDDRIALTRWGFVAIDEPVARALAINQISQEALESASAKLAGINWRADDAAAAALAATAPISSKLLGAVAYAALYPTDNRKPIVFDPSAFFRAVLEVPGFVFAADGVIYPQSETKRWVSTAIKIAEKLAPTVELDDAAPIEVKPEDIDKLVDKIVTSPASVTATRLLEENYEITPSNKTFPDDLANIMAALRSSDKVQWVGGDRFRKVGDFPDFIQELPEPFQFVQSDVTDEEGERKEKKL